MWKFSMYFLVVPLTMVVLCLPNSEAADKPGYCRDFDIDIKEGESVPGPIGRCVELTCRNAEKNDVSVLPCGLIVPPAQDCELHLEDLTKPYPYCCARFDC